MLQIYFSGYAPPEYVDTETIIKKFDVFSLGVIIIKVLAGPDGYYSFSYVQFPRLHLSGTRSQFFSYEDHNDHFLVVWLLMCFIVSQVWRFLIHFYCRFKETGGKCYWRQDGKMHHIWMCIATK